MEQIPILKIGLEVEHEQVARLSDLRKCRDSFKMAGAVEAAGYAQPTPVQQRAIPAVLQGRDLMVAAQTGTGKTGGFALPVLELLFPGGHPDKAHRHAAKQPRVLVLASEGKAFCAGVSVEDHLPHRVRPMLKAFHDVFRNLRAVCEAAGSSLAGIAKLNIYLTDLGHFAKVNEIMAQYFQAPYPARAAIGVASLPRGSRIEADGILVLG